MVKKRNDCVFDLDSDSFATAKSVTDSVNGTTGVITYSTISFTNSEADSVSAGECFRLQLGRDASSDTNSTDSQVIRIIVKES
jgi:hypothetical protein